MSADSLALRLEALATQRFGCDHCGKRFPGHGFCPNCPDEPLLDLADPHVQDMIRQAPPEHGSADEPRARRKFFAAIQFSITAATIGGALYLFMNPDLITHLLTKNIAVPLLLFGISMVFGILRVYELMSQISPPPIRLKLADISEDEWYLLAMLNDKEVRRT